MTIRDHIRKSALDLIERQSKLGLPPDLTTRARSAWTDGKCPVHGETELLDLDFSAVEIRTGRGGKKHLVFATAAGSVFYFPNARFGRYIKKGE